SPAVDLSKEGNPADVGTGVEIQVSDTGIGIPAESLGKVFDRFFQVDSSHTRAGEGTGIGLALSKELAELMGGGISVESEVGKGSVFTFWLPVAPPSPPGGGEMALPQHSLSGEGGENTLLLTFSSGEKDLPLTSSLGEPEVLPHPSSPPNKEAQSSAFSPPPGGLGGAAPVALVVEDNPDLRHFIKTSISPSWQVVEASDGEEGVRKAIELLPDLIISDLMMPRKDGYALCDELKNHELTAHIPIILLTAKAAIESKLKGLRTGADDYLTKPFNTEELLARMDNLVETRRRMRERYAQTPTALAAQQAEEVPEFLSEPDREFLRKFMLLIEGHLGDEMLGVEDFAQKMFLSRSQLHRKLKAITDLSPTDLIRDYRLDRACAMLKNREGLVGEVALRTGFGNEKYFSTAFKEKFGVSPSQVN
ncbi:MAG: response regulator, partial [Saprospiraceae bacterium]